MSTRVDVVSRAGETDWACAGQRPSVWMQWGRTRFPIQRGETPTRTEQTGGRVGVRREGWGGALMGRRVDRRMNGRMVLWVNGCMDGWKR